MTILLIVIAYITGIIMGLYTNIASVFFVFVTICLFRSIILFLSKYNNIAMKIDILIKKYLSLKRFILLLLVFFISYLYLALLEYSYENMNIKMEEEVNIQAIVISNCKEKEYKNVYKVKVESINNDKSYANTYFQLSVKNKKQQIEFGDRIEFKGELEEPSEARNYGGFNYKQYLKLNGIRGLITTSNISKIEKQKYNKILMFINNISTKITENANKILDSGEANLLTSILIGNKNNLSDDIEQSFRDSNLSHLLAVSGAHTTYVIFGITTFLNKFKLHKKITKLLTIVFLIFFIVLTGASSSVTRACIMAIYTIIGSLIYRKPNVIASICVSLLIILIINPYRILDIGLQLSYGGTIGIILFNKPFSKLFSKINVKERFIGKILKYIKEMLVVSISANIFIFPIIAFHYNTVSLTFFISNILAGPLLGIIIILGFLVIFISLISVEIAGFLSFLISIPLKLLILVANFSSNLPLSKIYVPTPSILKMIVYYIILFNIKKIFNRKVIAVLLIFVLLFHIIKIIPCDLQIYFIDVGQGDSSLIITPMHKTILIDGGGSSSSGYDIGKNVLLPYLLDRGITKLDYIIISHFDSDHVRTEF